MIGNDVVDIEVAMAESNIWRKGWQEKLFTADERTYINVSENPERVVWVFWSMKEAAYKAYNRKTGIRAFIPHKLACIIENATETSANGRIYVEDYVYYSKTEIINSIIHTVAVGDVSMFSKIQETESDLLRKDSNWLPYIIRNQKQLPASKSHHGNAIKTVVLHND